MRATGNRRRVSIQGSGMSVLQAGPHETNVIMCQFWELVRDTEVLHQGDKDAIDRLHDIWRQGMPTPESIILAHEYKGFDERQNDLFRLAAHDRETGRAALVGGMADREPERREVSAHAPEDGPCCGSPTGPSDVGTAHNGAR